MTAAGDDLTIVVGGGAAGIAAGRALHDAGRSVLVLEASDRLGGRAHSVRLRDLIDPDRSHPDWLPRFGADAVVDHGCGWLHSAERNPWVAIAEATGTAIDRTPPGWGRQWRDLGYSAADQAGFAAAYAEWDDAAHALLPLPDRSLADVPAPARWRPMLNAISGWANGADADAVSLHDWAAYDDAAGEENWALPGGYGTLIAGHARGVPHRLHCAVRRIDHHGQKIRVETDGGTLMAAAVIVCVASSVLHRIEFDPALPDKLAAAAALPLGLADKVFVAVDRPDWPRQAHLIGAPFATRTASHRLSPFDLPIVETFLGGGAAEAMRSEADACAFALDDLVGVLGGDWRARLHPLAATHWRGAAHIGGSYSHARVGQSAQRRALAESIDDRLFFAGEACHPTDFSTAHGAYASGIEAARAAMAPIPA